MTELSAVKASVNQASLKKESGSSEDIKKTDIRALKAQELREKARQGTSDISAKKTATDNTAPHSSLGSLKMAHNENTQSENQDQHTKTIAQSRKIPVTFIAAAFATVLWAAFCIYFFFAFGLPINPAVLGGYMAGTFTPPAILWLTVITFNRRSDIETLTEILRAELNKAPAHDEFALFAKEAEEISKITQNAFEDLRRARIALRSEMRDFAGMSKKTEFHIDRLANALSEKTKTLTSLSEQIEQNSTKIETSTDKAEAKSMAVANAFENSFGHLSRSVDDVNKRINEIGQGFDTQAEQLTEAASYISAETRKFSSNIDEDIKNTINILSDTLRQESEKLGALSKSAKIELSELNTSIKQTAEDIPELAGSVSSQLKNVQSDFKDVQTGLNSLSYESLKKLSAAKELFDSSLSALKTGSKDATDIIKDAGEALQTHTRDIEKTSTAVGEKLSKISASLKDQGTDIHLITDQAALRIEKMQTVLNEEFQGLSESVGGAITQFEQAGDVFTQQVIEIRGEMERTSAKFENLGQEIQLETGVLNEAAHQIFTDAKEISKQIQGETKTLLTSARETLSDAEEAAQAFGAFAGRFENKMNTSLKAAKTYGEELEIQTVNIIKATLQTVESIDSSVDTLKTSMNDIGTAANEVSVKIDKTQTRLDNECQRLLSVSTAALEGAREAGHTFTKQSESLFKASQDVAQHLETIERTQGKTNQEAFLGSAKFIVESLYSMSVDLSRVTEGKISEKTWKDFQNGNMSAFTTRLNVIGDNLPLDRAQDKFETDSEFRTYILRFIRQFEELYEQALSNDHGLLLSSAIGSSDLAKLYECLCRIAGKHPKTANRTSKAA